MILKQLIPSGTIKQFDNVTKFLLGQLSGHVKGAPRKYWGHEDHFKFNLFKTEPSLSGVEINSSYSGTLLLHHIHRYTFHNQRFSKKQKSYICHASKAQI
jgi:hypothetical protein